MRVYRIYSEGRLVSDAMGAKIAGGRWNPVGYRVLYGSSHLSLACLEKMVHLHGAGMPLALRWGWAEVEGELNSLDPRRQYVGLGKTATAEMGKQWLVHGGDLAVRVPSVLIPEEDNVLLNPGHPGYDELEWRTEPFLWDERLRVLLPAL